MNLTIKLHEAPSNLNSNFPIKEDETDFPMVVAQVPGKWDICGCCGGNGAHCHNIDGNGLPNDMAEDPEFMEDYMNGVYDKTCEECGGTGKVVIPNLARFNSDHHLIYNQWLKEENERYESDAIQAAERAMGA